MNKKMSVTAGVASGLQQNMAVSGGSTVTKSAASISACPAPVWASQLSILSSCNKRPTFFSHSDRFLCGVERPSEEFLRDSKQFQ